MTFKHDYLLVKQFAFLFKFITSALTVLLAVDTTSSNVPSPAPAASTENVIGTPKDAGEICSKPLIATRETSKTLQLKGEPAMCCSPLETLIENI